MTAVQGLSTGVMLLRLKNMRESGNALTYLPRIKRPIILNNDF